MEQKFKVAVNDEMQFQFTQKQLDDLDLTKISETNFHILQNHKSFKASLQKADFHSKSYTLKINSNTYEVNISNDLDLLIEEMGMSLVNAQVVNDIKAPMPGLILDVNVKEGDKVKEGDYLLVLEAMKMENTLTAPRDGVVKTVQIQKGETVDKGQMLIEME